jgi:hypothetical protein
VQLELFEMVDGGHVGLAAVALGHWLGAAL